MSNPLTDPAPVGGGVDTGVPDASTQVPPTAVGEASGVPEGYIPKDRFNGLMATYQRTEAELNSQLAEAQATIAALTEQLSARPEPEVTPPMSDSQIEELQAQLAAMQQMLIAQSMDQVKTQVLAEFPEAAPFADLIVANDPESYRQMAQEIANRAKGFVPPPAAPEGEPASVPEPNQPPAEPPVLGVPGGVPLTTPANVEDKKAEAIRNKDFQGFLAAVRAGEDELVTD